jgi:hypothetical protein
VVIVGLTTYTLGWHPGPERAGAHPGPDQAGPDRHERHRLEAIDDRRAGRVVVDRRQFSLDGCRFVFQGVAYGTSAHPGDRRLLAARRTIAADLHAMAEAGFTVVRTPAEAPDELLEPACDAGLRVVDTVGSLPWPELIGSSRRQAARLIREARRAVRSEVRRVADAPQVLALLLPPQDPTLLVPHLGLRRVAAILAEIAEEARDQDERLLLACGPLACGPLACGPLGCGPLACGPLAEGLAGEPRRGTEASLLGPIDFLSADALVARPSALAKPSALATYLKVCHELAPDRPVVVSIGAHAGAGFVGEARQARELGWQYATALEHGVAGICVCSWTDASATEGDRCLGPGFGLTRADGSPRPALDVASAWNSRTALDSRTAEDSRTALGLLPQRPSLTVVAGNEDAAVTIGDDLDRDACAQPLRPSTRVLGLDPSALDRSTGPTPAPPRGPELAAAAPTRRRRSLSLRHALRRRRGDRRARPTGP